MSAPRPASSGLFADHGYLWSILFWTVVLVAIATGWRARRRAILLGGLLFCPAALLAPLYVGPYWTPTLLWALPIGPEDVAFSFLTGAGPMLFVSLLPVDIALPARISVGRVVLRALVIGLPWLSVQLLLPVIGVHVITAYMVAVGALWLGLIAMRPRSFALSLWSGFAFGIWYTLHITWAFAVWPKLRDSWNEAHFWGRPGPLGIPLGELAWAYATGAVVPLVLFFVLEARIARVTAIAQPSVK